MKERIERAERGLRVLANGWLGYFVGKAIHDGDTEAVVAVLGSFALTAIIIFLTETLIYLRNP